jgi:hypothetical protein
MNEELEEYNKLLVIAKLKRNWHQIGVLTRLINIATNKDKVNKNPRTNHPMYFSATKAALLTQLE